LSRNERAEVMRRHLEKIIFYKGERGTELRKFFNRAESAEDFLKIIALIKE